MVDTTYAKIEEEVRLITGRKTQAQLTSNQIREFLNCFYLYDLPEYLRTFRLRQPYAFTTIPHVDTYNFPFNEYTSVEPAAFVGGHKLRWYQDTEVFYGVWPRIQQMQQIDTGDGGTTYSGTISAVPFLRCSTDATGAITLSNVLITASEPGNSQVLRDGPPFTGNAGKLYLYSDTDMLTPLGDINYETGSVTNITFPSNVSIGVPIQAQYIPFGAGRPIDIMFYNNQFTLRPIPDQAYQVDMVSYILPAEFLTVVDDPALKEWFLMLAFGTSLRVFKRYPDPEGQALAKANLQDEYDKMESRTVKQLSLQRANTIFSSPPAGQYAGYFIPPN